MSRVALFVSLALGSSTGYACYYGWCWTEWCCVMNLDTAQEFCGYYCLWCQCAMVP